MVLLLLGIAGCGDRSRGAGKREEQPGAAARVTVWVEPAQRRRLVVKVYGLGQTEALPDHRATITAAVQEEVRVIVVQPGSRVAERQPLVELRSSAARDALEQKKAERDALRASLRLLESRPREEERKGRDLAVAQTKLAMDKAQSQVERLRPLRQRNEISQQQMYEAELVLQQARLQVQTAEAELKVLLLGPRLQAVEEAQAKITVAEKAVAAAETDLALRTIHSPIAGTLDSLTCRLGQTLTVGSPVGEVVDLEKLDVLCWLAVRDAARVRAGQTAEVNATGSEGRKQEPWEPGPKTIRGRVVFVGRVVDPQTGNLPVRVRVENPSGRLVLGQSVPVAITVEERPDALAIPAEAMQDMGEQQVFSVVRGGKSVLLHAQWGIQERQWVEVRTTDLKPGEPVIVEGGYSLPDGTNVTVETPPADHRGSSGGGAAAGLPSGVAGGKSALLDKPAVAPSTVEADARKPR
jgi:RND family efflux transporter MFP subunit